MTVYAFKCVQWLFLVWCSSGHIIMLLQGLLECDIKYDSSYCCASLLFLLVGFKVNNILTLAWFWWMDIFFSRTWVFQEKKTIFIPQLMPTEWNEHCLKCCSSQEKLTATKALIKAISGSYCRATTHTHRAAMLVHWSVLRALCFQGSGTSGNKKFHFIVMEKEMKEHFGSVILSRLLGFPVDWKILR